MSLSRLQLAQQGLESDSPKIRIAVLGLDVQDTARRIVRLLLADALEEEQEWEKDLLQGDSSDKGILIRYGQRSNSNLPPTRTSIPTLSIPASLLERANLEILVSSIGSSGGDAVNNGYRIPADMFLSPTISTPTAASGRQTMISQPVHSTLVVTKGLDELMRLAELLASTRVVSEQDRQSITVSMEQHGTRLPTQGDTVIVDAQTAEDGLAAIRKSISEATTFEHKWVGSGIPSLSTWLEQTSDKTGPIPKALERLISSLLTAASSSIQTQITSEQATAASSKLSLASRTNLEASIEEFSRNAHSELQSGLASAWSSRNWRKLAWYKLFWRVDDVGLIISDLINNAWLPRTERAVYELSGRLSQAGISPIDMTPPPTPPAVALEDTAATSPATHPLPILQAQLSVAGTTDAPPPSQPIITNSTGTPTISLSPPPRPMPLSASISTTRTLTISRAITSLQHEAQQLVFRTLSITGFSAGLSTLTYLSLTPSVYESGTIVALGTAFALYRMQGGWQHATRELEEGLYDEGRREIQRVVGRMRELVDGDAVQRESAGERGLREAMGAVEGARVEFEKLKAGEVAEIKKRQS